MVVWLKQWLVRVLPAGMVDRLRASKRWFRRIRFRLGQRFRPAHVSRRDLIEAFGKVGLQRGDQVVVYSALSSFGHIDGGPATVVSALEEALGDSGLIVMPAFPIVGNAIEYLAKGQVFDLQQTRSNMGALTEYFRKLPGVQRSLHPTHSISARGPGATELVADHEHCPTPFGPGSPFVKMIDANMHLLCFGVDTHVFTLYHTFEDLSGDRFPHRVYLDRNFAVRCIDRDGRERVVTTPVHDPGVSKTRIDSNPRKEKQIRALLTEAGLLDRVRVGKGAIFRVRAKDLMNELDRWLEQGITIYG